jgi:hypothetical protein
VSLESDLRTQHLSLGVARTSQNAYGVVYEIERPIKTEDELIELNRRIVERLQLLRSARSLAQLAQFSVGMVVEFDTDDGRTISGTIARVNQNCHGRERIRTLAGEPRTPASRIDAARQDAFSEHRGAAAP